MAHHDVLIHLRRTDAATPAVAIGLALAERLRAWTTGIHIVPIAPAAFASPEAVALQVHEADQMVEEAKARRDWWLHQLAARTLQGEWQVSQGDTVEVLCHAARWSDPDRRRLLLWCVLAFGIMASVTLARFGALSAVAMLAPRKRSRPTSDDAAPGRSTVSASASSDAPSIKETGLWSSAS